jgi:hypothetical protein
MTTILTLTMNCRISHFPGPYSNCGSRRHHRLSAIYCQSLFVSVLSSIIFPIILVNFAAIIIDGQSVITPFLPDPPPHYNLVYQPFIYAFRLEPFILSSSSTDKVQWFPTHPVAVMSLSIFLLLVTALMYQAYPGLSIHLLVALQVLFVILLTLLPLIIFPLIFSSTPIRTDPISTQNLNHSSVSVVSSGEIDDDHADNNPHVAPPIPD